MRPPIDDLVAFYPTTDAQANHRFYAEIVGLETILEQSGCRIYRMSESGYIGFCERESTLAPPEKVVITLVTQDVDGWYARLTEAGIATDGPPRLNERYLITHFFATDPNGYQLEVQRFEDPRWPS